MDYMKLAGRELERILACNPPDVPHYQKAQGALQTQNRNREIRIQRWLLIFAGAGLVLELLRLFIVP